jgi:nitroimidazol reductase NimA-like FMN-containing flavoprotein (pyridoxamine 5'-phosphate oxidase superfamily)
MVVKLASMKAQEIQKLLREQILCRIAFKDAEDYGKKMTLLQLDNRVCVEIETIQPDMSEYHFVSLRGTLTSVDDPTERRTAIQRMAEDGRNNLSTNFLAAHGLEPREGWSSFTSEKPLRIFKLTILEKIGIKSP